MNGKSGSAMVEAALVFPLVILITAGFIRIAVGMHEHVASDSASHRSAVCGEIGKDRFDAVDTLRLRWISYRQESAVSQ